ncbi:DNA-binding response regulator [Hyphomicrobium methylovorum]|uniref:response regulator transcription factor n=1 Tax=Hyphomicrobium methylovorum TaxID=84 RepID=UPI0015E6840E|nr:response regulator [Hyphomicrobium methylovorum]MBA2126954.1 DNA-binding response regulator [Hyphomicrobium methylovorum]
MQQTQTKKTDTVFIVDDDPAVRDALRWLMGQVKLKVQVFSSADEFLANYTPETRGCIILDIRMPGMSGLELQERLKALGSLIPIIIITGHGDVSIAVRAMKAGAVEFLQKPFNDQLLLDTVQSALSTYGAIWEQEERRQEYNRSLSSLTKREKEVLNLLRTGKANKVIASILKISVRTVEGHRATIMSKTGAKSLGELIEMLHANT